MNDNAKVLISRRLDNARWWYWLYLFVFVTSMLFYRGWTPAAAIYRHTYNLSSPPGTLTSDRWTRPFVEDVLSVVLWLVPFTAAFMLCYMAQTWLHVFRAIMLFLFFAYFLVIFGFGCRDWTHANRGTTENALNPANDYRWCGVYFNLPGVECENSVAYTPGIGAGDLVVNKDFLFKFWFNVVLILFVVFDFFYMLKVYRAEVYRYSLRLLKQLESASETTQQQQQPASDQSSIQMRMPVYEQKQYISAQMPIPIRSATPSAPSRQQRYFPLMKIGATNL